MAPAAFWRLTLAEWRALLDGFEQKQKAAMRERAWTVSHLLVAAGCEPEKVTVAKLLGEKERKRMSAEERKRREAEKIWRRMQKDKGNGALKDSGMV